MTLAAALVILGASGAFSACLAVEMWEHHQRGAAALWGAVAIGLFAIGIAAGL